MCRATYRSADRWPSLASPPGLNRYSTEVVHGRSMHQLRKTHPSTFDETRGSPSWIARLGGWCFGHRLAAVGLWLFALVVVFSAAAAVGPAYQDTFDVPGADSS